MDWKMRQASVVRDESGEIVTMRTEFVDGDTLIFITHPGPQQVNAWNVLERRSLEAIELDDNEVDSD